MKNYITWLKTAAIFQFIAAIIHSISLFVTLPQTNETEKQLAALMDTYKFDLGAGFHRTMGELTLVFSVCFCLVCLFGGLVNWYLLKKKIEPQILNGVITINLFVFGILFGMTAAFAFLLPIVLIGLIVLFLVLSKIAVAVNSK